MAANDRVLISDVNGRITQVNTVWVARRRGAVLEQMAFHISERYTNLRRIGRGGPDDSRGNPTQDIVYVLAVDTGSENKPVVIVKNSGLLNNINHAWSVIKEIRFYRKTKKKFLHLFVELQDILLPMYMEFLNSRIEDSYLIYRFDGTMRFDELIASTIHPDGSNSYYYSFHIKQYQVILFQLLLVNLYLRSQKIQHRELVDSHIFVSRNHPLLPFKLQVFAVGSYGLGSGGSSLQHEVDNMVLRDERSKTRKYRPPEDILGISRYSEDYDLWSIGCLFGKLLYKKDLFDGENKEELFDHMINILGDPNPMDVDFIMDTDNEKARLFRIASLEKHADGLNIPGVPFPELISPEVFADPKGLDLLTQMLKFNPEHRISAEQALNHEFLRDIISYVPVLGKWSKEILKEYERNQNKQQGKDNEEDEDDEMISPADPEVVRKTLLREKFLFFNRKLLGSFT